jgi:hypothetical protein
LRPIKLFDWHRICARQTVVFMSAILYCKRAKEEKVQIETTDQVL